jgi:chromosome segregation ATPase
MIGGGYMLTRKLRLPAVSCVVLVSLVVCLIPCRSEGAEIKDVPKEHWAYQSVKSLVDKGYLGLYGDGTFQGTKAVDRYTLAVVIARILNEIDSGRIGATPEDVELLRKLSGEFREELVLIASELEMFKKTLDEHDKARQVTKEDIAKLTFTQREMKAEVDKIISGIVKDTEKLDGRITQVESKMTERISVTHELASNTESRLKELEMQVNTHETKFAQLEEDLSATVLRLTSLEPQVADIRKDVDAVSLAVSEQAAEIATSKEAVSQLEADVLELASKTEGKDLSLTDDLNALSGKTLSLEEAIRSERSARVSTYSSLESGITSLSSDLAAYKAQTSKDLDGLRKENGLLKVLLGLVAVLGIVIK